MSRMSKDLEHKTESVINQIKEVIDILKSNPSPNSITTIFKILESTMPLWHKLPGIHNKNLYHNYGYRELSLQIQLMKYQGFSDIEIGNVISDQTEQVHGVDLLLNSKQYELKSAETKSKKKINLYTAKLGEIDKVYNKLQDPNYKNSELVCGLYNKESIKPIIVFMLDQKDFEHFVLNHIPKALEELNKKTDNLKKKARDSVPLYYKDLCIYSSFKEIYRNEKFLTEKGLFIENKPPKKKEKR